MASGKASAPERLLFRETACRDSKFHGQILDRIEALTLSGASRSRRRLTSELSHCDPIQLSQTDPRNARKVVTDLQRELERTVNVQAVKDAEREAEARARSEADERLKENRNANKRILIPILQQFSLGFVGKAELDTIGYQLLLDRDLHFQVIGHHRGFAADNSEHFRGISEDLRRALVHTDEMAVPGKTPDLQTRLSDRHLPPVLNGTATIMQKLDLQYEYFVSKDFAAHVTTIQNDYLSRPSQSERDKGIRLQRQLQLADDMRNEYETSTAGDRRRVAEKTSARPPTGGSVSRPESQALQKTHLIKLIADSKATTSETQTYLETFISDNKFRKQVIETVQTYRSQESLVGYFKVMQLRHPLRNVPAHLQKWLFNDVVMIHIYQLFNLKAHVDRGGALSSVPHPAGPAVRTTQPAAPPAPASASGSRTANRAGSPPRSTPAGASGASAPAGETPRATSPPKPASTRREGSSSSSSKARRKGRSG